MKLNYIPLPLKAIRYLSDKLPFPALMVGGSLFAILYALFYTMPVFLIGPELYVWENFEEQKGFGIVVPTIPTFLIMCLLITTRLNQEVHRNLFSQGNNKAVAKELQRRFQGGGFWPIAMIAGTAMSVINVNWQGMVFTWSQNGFSESVSIIVGNFIIWSSVSLVLFFFLIEGHSYHRIGKKVPIDLYNLDSLNGFGRASLGGFLMVMCAMALSMLQSIDFEFSWSRYRSSFLVGGPASVTLALLPCWSIHRRLRRLKREHLAEISGAIADESNALDGQALLRMNALLARKKTIESVRTWPMDFSIFSRFILYVFIPPLAWVGAALMEIFLDSYIAG